MRHSHRLGLTGRISYWTSLHVVKDEVYNINDLTTSELGFDGALKYYMLDGFSIFARMFGAARASTTTRTSWPSSRA